MDQVERVAKYREQALNAAALVAALATSQCESNRRLKGLVERQDEQLSDLLHDIAYKARKMIELGLRYSHPYNAPLVLGGQGAEP